MNYIWEILLQARKEGIRDEDLNFVPARCASPYMEASLQDINRTKIGEERTIEINPFYRFYPIFKDLLHIDQTEHVELRNALFQVIVHLLAESDLKQGYNKVEYYKCFIERDIKQEVFGAKIKEQYEELKKQEQKIYLNYLLKLYQTGSSISLYRNVIQSIFPNSYLYNSTEDTKKLYLYLGERETTLLQHKISLIQDTFLPFEYQVDLFYEYHFGILGQEETMHCDQMVLV